MHIRDATDIDLAAMIPLWLDMCHSHARIEPIYKLVAGAEDEAKRHFQKCVHRHDRLLAVAIDGHTVAGYIAGSIRNPPPVFQPHPVAIITELAVTPELRRGGVGQALYGYARRWFAAKQISRIEVRTLLDNEQSNGFWKAMGFERYGVELRAGSS
jgi:ribosomal protein S18 acetylase RimI-like enzyme